MKRNVISLLVAAMVLIGLIAFVAPTAEAADTDPILYHCICGNKHSTALTDGEISWKDGTTACYEGCDGVIVEWTAWDANSVNNDKGYFYFGSNMTTVRTFGTAGKEFYIDLNGHDINVAGDRAIFIYAAADLVFCNTKTTGGNVTGGKSSANDEGGAINVAGAGSLTLYGIDVVSTSTTSKHGGTINVKGGSTFKMVDGSITGGTTAGNGGALSVYGTGTNVELYDVTVTGGTANNGGGICIWDSAAVWLKGNTTVSGGTAKADQGSNIHIKAGNLTIMGQSKVYGGINGTNTDRNIRISGGTVEVKGQAGVDGGITVSGGTLKVSEQAQIHHDVDTTRKSDRTVYLASGVVIDATGLASGAKIATDVAENTNVAKVANDADASILACFVAPSGKVSKFVEDGGVKYVQYGAPDDLYHCLCGNLHFDRADATEGTWKTGTSTHLGDCTGENMTWTAWTGSSTASPSNGDNVYLLQNRTTNMVVTGNSFNLDLNGFDWNAGAGEFKALAIAAGGADGKYVNICNSSDTASRITGMDTREQNGGVIGLTQDYTLKLYNVNVEADSQATTSLKTGGAIYISTGDFYMYGGSVTGRAVSQTGGAIHVETSATLQGVTISGGSASSGGNIFVKSGADIAIDDCTIYGGAVTKNGGNIEIDNTTDDITISNSIIYGGTAETDNGGNIWTAVSDKTLTLENCYVYGGSAQNGGSIIAQRNLLLDNTFVGYKPEGGTQGGEAADRGGNIFVYNGDTQATVTLQNGSKVAAGHAVSGGNIYLNGNGEKLVMKTGTSLNIGKATNGGNIYVKNDTVEMEGTASTWSGTATNGGSVYMAAGEFIMNDSAKITAATASVGGNVYIAGGNFRMNGSTTINTGNSTSGDQQDGNVYVAGGTLYMKGSASIYGGKRSSGTPRNVQLNGGTLDMAEGARIDGGITAGKGSIKLAGKVQIHESVAVSAENDRTIYLGTGVVIDATGLESGAKINVNGMANTANPVATISDPAIKTCFVSGIAANPNVLAKNDNKIYFSATAPVAEVTGYDYTDIAEAVTAANGTGIVKLMADVAEINAAGQTLNLDLNGHSVTGTVTAATLYGMDSTTNLYDDSECGSIAAVSGEVGSFYTHNDGTTIRRYVAIEDNGSYSFHRYYMTVTSVAVNPTSTAFTYKVAFLGDETIEQAVAAGDLKFGMAFKAETEGVDWLYSEMDATFVGGPYEEQTLDHNTYRYGIANVLKTGEDNATRAEMPINAKAYIKVDGETDESTEITRTFRQLVEKADAAWTDGTLTNETLQNSLKAMYATWSEVMSDWNLNKINVA